MKLQTHKTKYKTKVACTIGCIIVLSSTGALANDYALGLKAEQAGDYQSAVEHYQDALSQNYSATGFALARAYKKLSNSEKEWYWLKESAQSGYTLAQYELGLKYLSGDSTVSPNRIEAVYWLNKAASGNHGDSAYQLFLLTDDSAMLEVAAKQGVRPAMQTLSKAYKNGAYGLVSSSQKSQYWQNQLSGIEE